MHVTSKRDQGAGKAKGSRQECATERVNTLLLTAPTICRPAPPQMSSDQGLLDFAFDPSFDDNGFFYCSYTIDDEVCTWSASGASS